MKKITEVKKEELEERIERFVKQFVTFSDIECDSHYKEVKFISSAPYATADDDDGIHGHTTATLTVKKYSVYEEPMILNIQLDWSNSCECFYEYDILNKYPRKKR